jgi:hypothetical protein
LFTLPELTIRHDQREQASCQFLSLQFVEAMQLPTRLAADGGRNCSFLGFGGPESNTPLIPELRQ